MTNNLKNALQELELSRENIVTAIQSKGGTIADSAPLKDVPQAITNLPSGGNSKPSKIKDVNFYHYDGELLYAYTCEEAMALTALPPLPQGKDGLVVQEWNYTLELIKEEVEWQGLCVIGATCITDDGNTYFTFELFEDGRIIQLNFVQNAANGIIIDWGDGSAPESSSSKKVTTAQVETEYNGSALLGIHKYVNAGKYTIKLTPINDEVRFSWAGWYEGTYLIRYNDITVDTQTNVALSSTITNFKLGKGIPCFGYLTFHSFKIDKLNIPNYLINIRGGCFYNLTSLSTLILPKSLVTQATHATINSCSKLEVLSIPATIVSLGELIINATTTNIKQLCLPKNMPSSKISLPTGNRYIKKFKTPLAVTTYVDGTFNGCFNIEYINLSNLNITTLPSNFIYQCYKLKQFEIPNSVTTLNTNCFRECFNLVNIVLPENLTNIGANCFYSCSNLLQIKIPKGVSNITSSSFGYCSKLRIIDFTKHTTIPTLENVSAFAYTIDHSYNHTNPKIVVPKNLYNQWKTATNWSTYANYIYWEEDNEYHLENPNWTWTQGNVLPDLFLECESINSNNTKAYLSTLNRPDKYDLWLEAVINCPQAQSPEQRFGGDAGRFFGINSSGLLTNNGTVIANTNYIGQWINVKLHLYLNKSNLTYYTDLFVNNTLKHTYSSTAEAISIISIFGYGTGSGTALTSYITSNTNIAYYKITDLGTVVRELIPCIETATGTIGMYDTVLKLFLTNINTVGLFTAGPIGPHKTVEL